MVRNGRARPWGLDDATLVLARISASRTDEHEAPRRCPGRVRPVQGDGVEARRSGGND